MLIFLGLQPNRDINPTEGVYIYLLPWEPTTFIFRGYDAYVGGVKPSFFMVLGPKGIRIPYYRWDNHPQHREFVFIHFPPTCIPLEPAPLPSRVFACSPWRGQSPPGVSRHGQRFRMSRWEGFGSGSMVSWDQWVTYNPNIQSIYK